VSFSAYQHFGSDAANRYGTPGGLETAVAMPQP
jgi:hypothetical protein